MNHRPCDSRCEQANTAEFVPGFSVIDVLMNCGFGRNHRADPERLNENSLSDG
jgi:hypothetical protein